MKRIVFLLCFSFIATSCKKSQDNPYQSQGTIIGYDLRTCAMCGGLKITIQGDTTKNPPPFYEINADLQQLGISPSTSFPISVSLNWKHDPSALGAYNYIIVSALKVN